MYHLKYNIPKSIKISLTFIPKYPATVSNYPPRWAYSPARAIVRSQKIFDLDAFHLA